MFSILLLLSGSITAFAAGKGSGGAVGVTPSGIPLTRLEAFAGQFPDQAEI